MIKNYIKIAVRNLRRNPGNAFINITGLAVGIACCLLIGMYVWHEWSYDEFHEKSERLYRLIYEDRIGTNLSPAAPHEYKAWGSAALAPLMEQDFPEIEHTVRLSGRHQILLTRNDRAFQEESYFFADPDFFKVFSYPLLKGDPETALTQPNSIVLTESAAERYFGGKNVLGRSLEFGSGQPVINFTVTGVMADLPTNTHLDFEVLISMSTFENNVRANNQGYKFDNWGYIDFFTYVLLKRDTSDETLQAKFPSFVQRHNGDALQDPPRSYSLSLESITDAYLSPVSGFQPGPKGNKNSLYIFSFISIFILLIACVNFTNLATAQSVSRAKEVGIRKTAGAKRSSLVVQFITEAILLAGFAMILAIALVQMVHPVLEFFAGKQISLKFLTSLPMGGTLILATLILGLLAGCYPAFVISTFRPSQVLKGSFKSSDKGILLRKSLIVFQFTAAIALIVGTLVVRDQLHYLQGQPLGFDDEQQLILDFGGDGVVLDNLEGIKQELGRISGVQGVAATRSIPGGYFPHATTRIEAPDGTMQEINPGLYEVDADFLKQIDVESLSGRLFSSEYSTDTEKALLLNEAAARELGYADPDQVVGKRFLQWGREGKVVGVVNNFNYESLRHEVRPLTFRVSPWLNYFALQVTTENVSGVVADVREKWSELAPHRPFLASFLDQSFDAQYQYEERFGMLFGTFAALAIFVACLGLFGLAAYTAKQRTKEIGIRKVLGATVTDIMGLLSKDFIKLVMIGFLIAVPITWLAMGYWLQNFAYRIEIGPDVFILAGITALVIALTTVSRQSVKAALANPTDSLKSE